MRRVGGLALLVLAACRPPADPGTPAGPPAVPDIAAVEATVDELREELTAFAAVAGDEEPPEVRDARATLAEAEARAALAREQVHRLAILEREAIAPQREVEAARAELATTAAAAARARAALAAFGRAPASAARRAGEAWAFAQVAQRDLPRVTAGAAAEMTLDALPGRTFVGRVAAGPSYVSSQTLTAPVRLALHDPEGLLHPGMTGAARLAVGDPRRAVVVPSAAVLHDGARTVVIVEEAPGRFVPRAVEVGLVSGARTEIRAGLEPGARVATTGAASGLSAARLRAAGD